MHVTVASYFSASAPRCTFPDSPSARTAAVRELAEDAKLEWLMVSSQMSLQALKHDDSAASGLERRKSSLKIARIHLEDGTEQTVAEFVPRSALQLPPVTESQQEVCHNAEDIFVFLFFSFATIASQSSTRVLCPMMSALRHRRFALWDIT